MKNLSVENFKMWRLGVSKDEPILERKGSYCASWRWQDGTIWISQKALLETIKKMWRNSRSSERNRFVIVTRITMRPADTQRLQLEDNAPIMKLARINDEKENETSHIVSVECWKSPDLLTRRQNGNKLRSKFAGEIEWNKIIFIKWRHVQFLDSK